MAVAVMIDLDVSSSSCPRREEMKLIRLCCNVVQHVRPSPSSILFRIDCEYYSNVGFSCRPERTRFSAVDSIYRPLFYLASLCWMYPGMHRRDHSSLARQILRPRLSGLNNQLGVAMQQSSSQFYREAFGAVEERLSAFRDPSNAKKSVRSEGHLGGERE
eukprot:scaffold16660_cov35-Cyclotella_meneghiniana.AAC.1